MTDLNEPVDTDSSTRFGVYKCSQCGNTYFNKSGFVGHFGVNCDIEEEKE